jgi:hypothetical protein
VLNWRDRGWYSWSESDWLGFLAQSVVIGQGHYLEQMVELGHVRDDRELVRDVAVHHILVQQRAGQQGFFGNILSYLWVRKKAGDSYLLM